MAPSRQGHQQGRAAWGWGCSPGCPRDTRFLSAESSQEGWPRSERWGLESDRWTEPPCTEQAAGRSSRPRQQGPEGLRYPLGRRRGAVLGAVGGGAARPTPRRTVSTCARRTTTSVPRAGTAGSSSAATAAPGPSTWPACPHHCSRSPGEPGVPVTSTAPKALPEGGCPETCIPQSGAGAWDSAAHLPVWPHCPPRRASGAPEGGEAEGRPEAKNGSPAPEQPRSAAQTPVSIQPHPNKALLWTGVGGGSTDAQSCTPRSLAGVRPPRSASWHPIPWPSGPHPPPPAPTG